MSRRKYTKREKLAAVMAAEMGGVTEAGEQTGIPKTTIQYWLDQPEFAQFRTKAREELQDEIKVVAHLAWRRAAQALQDGSMDTRDALFAAEKATTLMMLVGGEATSRTETRSLTDTFDDHELDLLRSAVQREAAAETAPQAAVVDPGEAEPASPED